MSAIRLKYSIDSQTTQDWRTKAEVKKVWLNLKNLTEEDKQYIQSNFKGIERGDEISFPTTKPSIYDFPDTAKILGVLEYLQSTGHYAMPTVDIFVQKLKHALKDAVTKQDMSDAKKSTDEMWIEFMNRIEEPDMKSLIQSITPYYIGDSTYGWKLAFEQALRVKKYKPDATFVKTRRQWERDYNREINLDATRLLILVPYDSQVQSHHDTMSQVGYNSDKKFGDLSKQQQEFVDIKSRSGAGKHYHWQPVYDVSDTTVKEGEEDVFNNTIGFKNNLTGELNQHAINDKLQNGFSSEDDVNKIYHNETGNVQLLTTALAQGIQKNFVDVKALLPQNTKNENAYMSAFETMVCNLADKLIEDKAKIVKAENRQKGIEAVLIAVCALCRINARKVGLNLANDNFSPKYYYELREIINAIVSLINKNMPRQENRLRINEEVPMLTSIEDLYDILNISEEDVESEEVYESKQQQKAILKEGFYNFFNKLLK